MGKIYTGLVELENITPQDNYHYFFGYYDLQPFDKEGKKHLAHRVAFADHIPTAEEFAEVGYITIEDKRFHKVAETSTWNFQQGALLQWFDDENIIYNDFRDGNYCAVVKNITSDDERIICVPLANISLDRKWGLSINFSRVWDFRPGYGYCNLKDEYYNENAPEEDGIFLVDIEKNESKLIISYKQLAEAFPQKPFSEMKLLVNHITFNPSANRFLFLLRNFPKTSRKWGTILLTADRNGRNVKNLTNYEVNSHYHWKNDEEIIIYSGLPRWGIYLFNDKTKERTMLDDDLVNTDDIHCIYSPDRSCFIGDGYPDKDNYRHIFLYNFNTQKSCELLKVYSNPVSTTDIRCDLHNRFNRDGNKVSFDSYHNGRREICLFPFCKESLLSKE